MAKYWLFQVMHDHFPTLWDSLVRHRLAAQHYPDDWANAIPNVGRLRQMRRGDHIVAAFTKHRFAGYGVLQSDFERRGPSLIIRGDEHKSLAFEERFDCEWTVIPHDRDIPYIDCHDLKGAGFVVDLERGRAVQQIDKRSFVAIKSRLDMAGARKPVNVWLVKALAENWHWRDYFDYSRKVYKWGGDEWIKSKQSMKLLRDEVRKDDIVVAYHRDDPEFGRSILGLTRMASNGKQESARSGQFNCFDIVASDEAFKFSPPLTVDELRRFGCHPKCLGLGTQGTLFPVLPSELREIVSAYVAIAPSQQEEVQEWLHEFGFSQTFVVTPLMRGHTRDSWDSGCIPGNVDEILEDREARLRNRSDVYVQRLVNRWIRQDRPVIRALKAKYDYHCQYPGCDSEIPMRNGINYCEVAHIRAVARGGDATRINLIVLCPNHHKPTFPRWVEPGDPSGSQCLAV